MDDEKDTSEAMAIGLERYGARVAMASSAREALDTLVRERPEVLVADIGMAGEDGYSLLQRVRALPPERGGATPAIALTGYASEQVGWTQSGRASRCTSRSRSRPPSWPPQSSL